MDDDIRYMLDIASVRREMQAICHQLFCKCVEKGATSSHLFEDRTHDINPHRFQI